MNRVVQDFCDVRKLIFDVAEDCFVNFSLVIVKISLEAHFVMVESRKGLCPSIKVPFSVFLFNILSCDVMNLNPQQKYVRGKIGCGAGCIFRILHLYFFFLSATQWSV